MLLNLLTGFFLDIPLAGEYTGYRLGSSHGVLSYGANELSSGHGCKTSHRQLAAQGNAFGGTITEVCGGLVLIAGSSTPNLT
jgi:hypothetical protein